MSILPIAAIQFVFSVGFLYSWFIVGKADRDRQKVTNAFLRFAARAAVFGYAAALLLAALNRFLGQPFETPNAMFYRKALSDCAFCAGAAMTLWYLDVWPAGDAKLFMLLGAIYPLTNFLAPSRDPRLFFSALVNSFLPASVAVFLRAGRYVFDTRLSHRRRFLTQLGWRKEVDFMLEGFRSIWGRVRDFPHAAAGLAVWREKNPTALLRSFASWAADALLLSIFSYYLRDLLTTPLSSAVFWGAALALRENISLRFGKVAPTAVLTAAAAALLELHPPHWPALGALALELAAFGLCFGAGMRLMLSMTSGDVQSAYVLTLVAPLMFVFGGAMTAFFHSLRAETLMIMAVIGIFFGSGLVMVRLWDREVLPNAAEEITSYAVLSSSFVDRLKQDREFFNEHFSRLYADGLTTEQAAALRDWCARNSVGMIPLTPTISFAAWIFLGFFLARVMNGANVLDLLFTVTRSR